VCTVAYANLMQIVQFSEESLGRKKLIGLCTLHVERVRGDRETERLEGIAYLYNGIVQFRY